jgi:hypothetical protein
VNLADLEVHLGDVHVGDVHLAEGRDEGRLLGCDEGRFKWSIFQFTNDQYFTFFEVKLRRAESVVRWVTDFYIWKS